MSIQETVNKIKSLVSDELTFTTLLILLVGVASFGLGRQSISTPIAPQAHVTTAPHHDNTKLDTPVSMATSTPKELLVASKNSDKYHLPWCSGAGRISEVNKIYFDSEADAKAAGYSPAANCEGL
ncbi:MAG: hypothetical protein AAFO91_11810 [Bacteroidota bacterium]